MMIETNWLIEIKFQMAYQFDGEKEAFPIIMIQYSLIFPDYLKTIQDGFFYNTLTLLMDSYNTNVFTIKISFYQTHIKV